MIQFDVRFSFFKKNSCYFLFESSFKYINALCNIKRQTGILCLIISLHTRNFPDPFSIYLFKLSNKLRSRTPQMCSVARKIEQLCFRLPLSDLRGEAGGRRDVSEAEQRKEERPGPGWLHRGDLSLCVRTSTSFLLFFTSCGTFPSTNYHPPPPPLLPNPSTQTAIASSTGSTDWNQTGGNKIIFLQRGWNQSELSYLILFNRLYS